MSTLSLEATAYRELKQRIARAEYMPGTMLSENELADQLGMSRTPIRSAISLLETDGLVESLKGRGVLVKDVSFRDFAEMFEVLVSLQLFVIEKAAKRGIRFDTEALRRDLDKQIAAVRTEDNVGYYESSLNFTETILNALPNASMQRILDSYRVKFTFKMVSYRKQYPQYKPQRSKNTNEKIYAALADNDYEAAKEALEAHYNGNYEQLMLFGMI